MPPCPYCGTPMANPRRVQCGAAECKRRHKASYMREWQRSYKSKHGRWHNEGSRNKHPRTCAHCKTSWNATSASARFCSFACQAAHQHGEQRTRKLSRGQRRRLAAAARLELAAQGSRSRTPWVCGRCSECDEPFTTPLPLARTCSSSCGAARARRRRRGRSKYVTDQARLAIYERDGWTCQLCFTAVDPDLHYLDDWAASLDHIVCRSWSKTPDHSPQNLRLTHRWCNSVRGDESAYGATELAELLGVST